MSQFTEPRLLQVEYVQSFVSLDKKKRVSNLSDICAIEHWLNDDSAAMIA
jgi:hypothetical protein